MRPPHTLRQVPRLANLRKTRRTQRVVGAGAPSIVHRCDARSFAFGNLRGKRARKSAYSVRFFPDTAASTIKLSLGWK